VTILGDESGTRISRRVRGTGGLIVRRKDKDLCSALSMMLVARALELLSKDHTVCPVTHTVTLQLFKRVRRRH